MVAPGEVGESLASAGLKTNDTVYVGGLFFGYGRAGCSGSGEIIAREVRIVED